MQCLSSDIILHEIGRDVHYKSHRSRDSAVHYLLKKFYQSTLLLPALTLLLLALISRIFLFSRSANF